jgi:hypothetical protein
MKIRRLQRKFGDEGWYDDAYAYENVNGEVIFCYNLTWESMGARANQKLQETGVTLDRIETIVPQGKALRWLAVEVMDEHTAVAYLAELNDRCDIPQGQLVAEALFA